MPNSIDVPLPIQVSASSAQSAVMAALRVLITLLTGFGALAGLMKKADLEGIYAFFQGEQGFAFISAGIAVVTFGTSLWITIRKHRKLVVVAEAAPNSVAKVTS